MFYWTLSAVNDNDNDNQILRRASGFRLQES